MIPKDMPKQHTSDPTVLPSELPLIWQVCRFWVYELREDMAKCVAKVAAHIKK